MCHYNGAFRLCARKGGSAFFLTGFRGAPASKRPSSLSWRRGGDSRPRRGVHWFLDAEGGLNTVNLREKAISSRTYVSKSVAIMGGGRGCVTIVGFLKDSHSKAEIWRQPKPVFPAKAGNQDLFPTFLTASDCLLHHDTASKRNPSFYISVRV
jgi:hypothetical protein